MLKLETLALAFPLLLAGCFVASTPDRCEETRVCMAANGLGCCDGAGIDVSVCETCPAGTVETYMCRTTGCDTCTDPVSCRIDFGEGCCGDAVFASTCDACPAGSVLADSCTADFPAECGCPGTIGPFVPPSDGRPAEDAIAPPSNCVEDLGDGCCGAFVTADTACGCPPGTRYEYECTMFGGGIAPPSSCRTDLGGGCCGAAVEANACTAMCPAGSIPAELCEAQAAPARPAPLDCFVLLADGCCSTEIAEADACGVCPEGTSSECLDFCEGI